MKKIFSVTGMTCSNCSLAVEKAVANLKGVNSVNVSLLEKKLTVDYDNSLLKIEDIIVAVKSRGYGCYESTNILKEKEKNKQTSYLLKRFIISLGFLIALLYFSMGKMLNVPLPSTRINLILQAGLALAVIIVNGKIYIKGIKSLFLGTPGMDTLITLGSLTGYVYSLVVMIIYFITDKVGGVFFEASAMVLTLINLGKFLEEFSKEKTGKEVDKLLNLIPDEVTVISNGKEIKVSSQSLKVGDIIVARGGDYVFVDGVIVDGQISVDKSAITGESMPAQLTIGESVISGSVVRNGYALIKAEKVLDDTLFAKIIERVKVAGASKSPYQKLADKISGIFVPIVSAIAIITLVVWLLVNGNEYDAFNYAVSVLVISCPCALGLATPVAVMVGIGKGASLGILFKDAVSLQKLKDVNCVLLDKTATLTEGKMTVEEFKNFSKISDETLLEIAYALEEKSSHPLAESLKNYAKTTGKKVDGFNYGIGVGIVGEIDGIKYALGNYKIAPNGVKFSKYEKTSKTTLYLFDEKELLCAFVIGDKLKSGSKQAVINLKEQGIETVMITGDEKVSATYFAKELGISEVEYNVLPMDKYQKVIDYQNQGKTVAMVGDGINDSPALKQADVGVAIGTGTDIAIESADVVLMDGKISSLLKAIELSKKSVRIIKGNLFWAFIYNLLAIPVSAGVLSPIGVILTPAISSACMCLSSLFVVTNALRLNRLKTKKVKEKRDMQLKVEGMMCKHCEARVKEGVSSIEGVNSVEINLKKKLVIIDANEELKPQIVQKITELGYEVK